MPCARVINILPAYDGSIVTQMNAFIHGKHACGAKGERKTDPWGPLIFQRWIQSEEAGKETEEKQSEVQQENQERAGAQGWKCRAFRYDRISLQSPPIQMWGCCKIPRFTYKWVENITYCRAQMGNGIVMALTFFGKEKPLPSDRNKTESLFKISQWNTAHHSNFNVLFSSHETDQRCGACSTSDHTIPIIILVPIHLPSLDY